MTSYNIAALQWALCLGLLAGSGQAVGYRTVGSSGVGAQMVFIPPYTQKAVFIDNYHLNYGQSGLNFATGQPGTTQWVYPDTNTSVFGAEMDLNTFALRALYPKDNTFCSIGAFFPNGTLVNLAGSGGFDSEGVGEGFNNIRTYAPGPCLNNACTQDWVEQGTMLSRRWYPSVVNLVNGDIVVIGGSTVGGLTVNQAAINNPTYQVISQNSSLPARQIFLPILNFTSAQNQQPGYAYNLYPSTILLPNSGNRNWVFILAGNRSVVWDFSLNQQYLALPNIPNAARNFPSSATVVLLPQRAPFTNPTILVCGGSSNDMPNAVGVADCWTIQPLAPNAAWVQTDSLPNGGQTQSNGVLLPNGDVLILNGARLGTGGQWMAENPVLTPLVYNPTNPAGARFTNLTTVTKIARMYHSVAILLPNAQVLVAGSNPTVSYSRSGKDTNPMYPYVNNSGVRCYLNNQQYLNSSYPTEYRVEYFSPLYSASLAPVIAAAPAAINYNTPFSINGTYNGGATSGNVRVVLMAPGFTTHAQGQGQRMVFLPSSQVSGTTGLTVTGPLNGSVMPPGIYYLFLVVNGVPSQSVWISLS